jgi:hypothetical protein
MTDEPTNEPIDYYDEELGRWISPEEHEIMVILQECHGTNPGIQEEQVAPMPFTPYFDDSIKEEIDAQKLHDLVVKIKAMKLEELNEYLQDLETEQAIDPNFEKTHEGRVALKTMLRTIQACRKRGEMLKAPAAKLDPWRVAEAIGHGWIIGDEFSKRTGTW